MGGHAVWQLITCGILSFVANISFGISALGIALIFEIGYFLLIALDIFDDDSLTQANVLLTVGLLPIACVEATYLRTVVNLRLGIILGISTAVCTVLGVIFLEKNDNKWFSRILGFFLLGAFLLLTIILWHKHCGVRNSFFAFCVNRRRQSMSAKPNITKNSQSFETEPLRSADNTVVSNNTLLDMILIDTPVQPQPQPSPIGRRKAGVQSAPATPHHRSLATNNRDIAMATPQKPDRCVDNSSSQQQTMSAPFTITQISGYTVDQTVTNPIQRRHSELPNDGIHWPVNTPFRVIILLIVGVISGLLRGMWGVGGIPIMFFAMMSNINKDEFRGSAALAMCFSECAAAIELLWVKKHFKSGDWPQYIVIITMGFFGLLFGNAVLAPIMNQTAFHLLIIYLILCGGIVLSTRGLSERSDVIVSLSCIFTGIAVVLFWCLRRLLYPDSKSRQSVDQLMYFPESQCHEHHDDQTSEVEIPEITDTRTVD